MTYLTRPIGCALLLTVLASIPIGGSADTVASPWVFDLKGGLYKPDLPLYEDFYGDDTDVLVGLAFAYRFTQWLDLGVELSYARDKGVGLQPANMSLGGKVTYTLVPASVYLNFRGELSPDQLFVPYVGGGLTTAWYKQDVESQGSRDGRTDLGYNVRGGVQLFLNRLDRRTAARAAKGYLQRSYLYFEVQYFSTEVDGFDLGGVAYLLGLRMEYAFDRD